MHRLADVELQLVMHGLTGSQLLQFARCSRRLLHAADSAFAWRYTEATVVSTFAWRTPFLKVSTGASAVAPSPDSASGVRPLGHPLRYAQLRLQLRFNEAGGRSNRAFEVSASIGASLRSLDARLSHAHEQGWVFRALDSTNVPLSSSEFRGVLAHPALRDLRALTCGAGGVRMDEDALALIAQSMSHLHTLHLHAASWEAPAGGSSIPALLSSLPALTSLRLCFESDSSPVEGIPTALTLCASLTQLDLVRSFLYGPSHFLPLFAAPLMQANLQSLRLERWSATRNKRVVTDAECKAAFASMSALHTLVLVCVKGPNHLLANLTRAPALRSLCIQMDSPAEEFLPSVGALQCLLTARPELRCNMLVKVTNDSIARQRTDRRFGALIAVGPPGGVASGSRFSLTLSD